VQTYSKLTDTLFHQHTATNILNILLSIFDYHVPGDLCSCPLPRLYATVKIGLHDVDDNDDDMIIQQNHRHCQINMKLSSL